MSKQANIINITHNYRKEMFLSMPFQKKTKMMQSNFLVIAKTQICNSADKLGVRADLR